MMTQNKLDQEKDKSILIDIVNGMAASFSGAESTKHWAKDALWFDIPPFASKGIQPAIQMFDKVFGGMKSCEVSIKDTEVTLSEDLGVVCTIQEVAITFKDGQRKIMFVRETDCFKKTEGAWSLFHQHASVPSGGEWDGRIIKA